MLFRRRANHGQEVQPWHRSRVRALHGDLADSAEEWTHANRDGRLGSGLGRGHHVWPQSASERYRTLPTTEVHREAITAFAQIPNCLRVLPRGGALFRDVRRPPRGRRGPGTSSATRTSAPAARSSMTGS